MIHTIKYTFLFILFENNLQVSDYLLIIKNCRGRKESLLRTLQLILVLNY
jgi:hypothetical protein